MNRTPSPAATLLVVLILPLAACNWDDEQQQFDNYPSLAASGVFSDPRMPAKLVPRSARAIAVGIVTDMKETTLDFDFAPADRAAVAGGFKLLPPAEQAQLRDERWFTLRDPASALLKRCGAEQVEFLALGAGNHAHYQSTPFPDTLAKYCRP